MTNFGDNLATYPDLAGKVVVVTGGSRGIGAATCRSFAANGARVVVNGRDERAIDATTQAILTAGGAAIGVSADCANFQAIERLREQTEQAFGPVDALVAFAGGDGPPPVPTEQQSEEHWRAVIDGNLTATFLTVKSFLPGMLERGRGSIVTMASSAARLPSRSSAAYAAAKAGVVMFSRHVANEVAKSGVRVNCVAPSSILTERTEGLMPGPVREQVAAMHPLGRLGLPEDVANAALFLASDSASWLTGVTLDIAGGRVMI